MGGFCLSPFNYRSLPPLSHSLARSLVVVSVGLEFRVQHSRIAGPEEEEEHEEEEEEEEEMHGREAV
jgi:hypothetical protein